PLHLVLFVIAVGRDEAVAAEVGLVQPTALDHHAPTAVEDQDAFLGRRVQGGDAFCAGHVWAPWGVESPSTTSWSPSPLTRGGDNAAVSSPREAGGGGSERSGETEGLFTQSLP